MVNPVDREMKAELPARLLAGFRIFVSAFILLPSI
jgi:hypothetical protein